MGRTILIYGLLMALLVFVLKLVEYRMVVQDMATDAAFGGIAVLFLVLGIVMGIKLTRKERVLPSPVSASPVSTGDIQHAEDRLKQTGISQREYEVLELMARGLSNQEIADALFVSLNTVKTHSSNLFLKLDVKRRTQAVQRARDMGILKNA
jgi:DNA-binding CsgD family transcriptional regulator